MTCLPLLGCKVCAHCSVPSTCVVVKPSYFFFHYMKILCKTFCEHHHTVRLRLPDGTEMPFLLLCRNQELPFSHVYPSLNPTAFIKVRSHRKLYYQELFPGGGFLDQTGMDILNFLKLFSSFPGKLFQFMFAQAVFLSTLHPQTNTEYFHCLIVC